MVDAPDSRAQSIPKDSHQAAPPGLSGGVLGVISSSPDIHPAQQPDSDLLGKVIPSKDSRGLLDRSGLFLCLLAAFIGVLGEGAAWSLFKLIGLFTNLSFRGQFSFAFYAPTTAHVGWWVLLIPAAGGIVVGLMARYGSEMIRGHGIPEAMASALFHDSKIPARVAVLKPLSAAVSIGTGCPFGAEGPIIATGAALGSIVGQIITVTKERRRVLLAAGAAAGMSATFGAPLASILMALELLLFEFQPISILAVAIASGVAAGLRIAVTGTTPIFAMPALPVPTLEPLTIYAAIGVMCGLLAVLLTHGLYFVERLFKKYSHVHWMWWPAMGGVVVGVCGLIFNPSMGVGYVNIRHILGGKGGLEFAGLLLLTRMVSWTVALGSGTSGSTMAPLFNIGSALGAVVAITILHLIPHADVNVRAAALVGMAALFCGATWTPLTSIVFAFETTLRPNGLAPIVAGCTTSFLVSCALMRSNLLTEKFARSGGRALFRPQADFMDSVLVKEAFTPDPFCLGGDETCDSARKKVATDEKYMPYDGFPIIDEHQHLLGVLTTHDLLNPETPPETRLSAMIRRPPVVIYSDCSLRRADQMMVRHAVGRLVVMDRDAPSKILGIITRDDLLTAHRQRS
ncbi:MAG: chloride channel protein [Phycisphaerae bacterium]|nr:chloride channel protein [Phycisphaerae bacterium]